MSDHTASRLVCAQCQRPGSYCLCSYIPSIVNQIAVLILQHPHEHKHPLNTARLVKLGLQNASLLVGEQFIELKNIISLYDQVFLLYPATKNDSTQPLEPLKNQESCLMIVPDGTWRNVRKIMNVNPLLQTMTRIDLPEGRNSEYEIRKTREKAAVSTIEAIERTLSVLEPNTDFQPLLTPFRVLIQQQIQAMGKEIYARNYLK